MPTLKRTQAAFVNTPYGLWDALKNPGTLVNNAAGQRQNGPNGTGETANLGLNSRNAPTGIITGPGIITGINVSMGSGLAQLRKDGVLVMYFDEGLATAYTVTIHLCMLHMLISPLDVTTTGPGYDLYQLKIGNNCLSTRAFTVQYAPWWNGSSPSQSSNGMRFRLSVPMPFKTFRMTIKGQTATNYSAVAQIWTNITWTPSIQSNLQFRCTMNPAVSGTTAYTNPLGPMLTTQVYDLATIAAGTKGWLMGHMTAALGSDTNQTLSWLERDMSFYRDQEASPNYTWSSWEDYFESAFYANQGPWLQCNPFHFTAFCCANSGSARQSGFTAFKEFQYPLRFSNGCILRSEFQPDKADGFLNDTALCLSMTFWIQEP